MYKYIKEIIKRVNVSINEINMDLPNIQREENNDAIKSLCTFQNEFYNIHNYYFIIGTITIASFMKSGKEYLIDGQHRVKAFKYLQKMYPERKIELTIDYIIFDDTNEDEATEYLYKLVNTCTPNKIACLSIDHYKILQDIEKYFNKNFKVYLKTSTNPQKPHINLDKLKNYIRENNIIEKLNIRTSEEILTMIINLNRYYSHLTPEQFKKFGLKDIHNLIQKKMKYNNELYLGFWNKFEWVERLVDSKQSGKTYDQLLHITYDYRPKIPASLRKKVWNNQYINSECYCCIESISFDDFECGHIIPVSLGGLTNFENLRPICHSCNIDMKCMNIEEYKNLLLL